MNKKVLTIIIIVLIVIMLIPIPKHKADGGTVEYKAILYSITKYHISNPHSSKGYDDGMKVKIFGIVVHDEINTYVDAGNIFMTLDNFQNIIKDYMTRNYDKNYAYNYIDQDKSKIVVGLVENTKEEQENFISKVFFTNEKNYIIENNCIEFIESKDVFKAKIESINEESLTAIVLKDSKGLKKDDKVLIKNNENDDYHQDMIIEVTYNGLIEESNPAQIAAIKIEIVDIK